MKATSALVIVALTLVALPAGAKTENLGLQPPYEALSEQYLIVQQKLAADDFNGVTAAAKTMLQALDHGPGQPFPADFQAAVKQLAAASDLATARAAFKDVSTDLVAQFKQEHISTGVLHEVYCPAARGCWIQTDAKEAHNPYFGKERPNCGDTIGNF
jgi:hypothetical protein